MYCMYTGIVIVEQLRRHLANTVMHWTSMSQTWVPWKGQCFYQASHCLLPKEHVEMLERMCLYLEGHFLSDQTHGDDMSGCDLEFSPTQRWIVMQQVTLK